MSKEPVTLINLFTVPPGFEEQAIAAWEVARDFLSQQPGYISTELHQALSPEAPHALINVAKWESAEDFGSATTAMRQDAAVPVVAGVRSAPQLFRVVRR